MDQISKLIQRRLQAAPDQETNHPDPDLLAAFTEKALARTERVQVLDHLAQCSDCRDIVSLATPEFETTGAVTAASRSGWLSGSVLRWGAVAASVAVVTVAVTLPRFMHHQTLVPAPQSATLTKGNAAEARIKADDRFAASVSPSSDRAREVDSAAKPARRAAFSDRVNLGGSVASSRLSKTAPVPASPPLLAKSVDEERPVEAEKKEQERNDKNLNAAGEVVLEAKAAPAELETAPGKAKDAPQKTQAAQARLASDTRLALANRTMADATSNKTDDLRGRANLVPRWTLSSDGTLQRSFDSGKTWATISVAGNAVFRALAAVGANIWVGGSGGSLYRSIDAGEHWLKLKPAAGGKVLTADIIGVEFTDSQHGKLTTADEQIWVTADAGQTWQTN